MKKLFAFLLCFFSFCINICYCQSDKNSYNLDEIVVTATKTKKEISNVPASVSVITSKDIELKEMHSIDDVLNDLQGIYFKRSKFLMDSTAGIRMRGFMGDKYVLIMIDGLPINDAYTGGVKWDDIPIDSVEKIEIIRGPGSTLYGGNAVAGVINIITKTPKKFNFQAKGGLGTYSTKKYSVLGGDKIFHKLSFMIGFEGEETDGYPTTVVKKSIRTGTGNVSGGYLMNDKYGHPKYWVVGNKGDNGARRNVITGKLKFDLSETGKISFTTINGIYKYDYDKPHTYMGTYGSTSTYAIAGEDKKAQFKPYDFISYTGIGRKETGAYTLSYEDIFGNLNFYSQVGLVKTEDKYTLAKGSSLNFYYDSPGKLSITKTRAWFGEIRGSFHLFEKHTLTIGTSYRTDDADTNEYPIPFYRSFDHHEECTFHSGGESKTWALYLQEEWDLLNNLTIYLGARYDWWKVFDGYSGKPNLEEKYKSNTDSHVSPKISLVYKPLENTVLRLSAGNAFRPPTIYELYRTWQWWSTTYQSNPNLKPETVWTYEAGVEQYLFNKKTKLNITGYLNHIDDLVYTRIEGHNKIRTNAGKGRTYGLETGINHKLFPWMNIWTNLTLTNAKITDNPADPESEDKKVPGIPTTTWNFGIDTSYKIIKASLEGRYFSKIYTDDHNKDKEEGVYGTYEPAFLMDGKIIITPIKHMEVSLSVDNILNKRYYEYYKTPGRICLFEITYRY